MRFLATFALLLFISHHACAQKYADILMDAQTGSVLHGTDPDGHRYPASLTKIMTLYILFEALKAGKITFHTTYAVSRNAINVEPCRLGLRVGQRISVRNIILSLITKSANDASVVAAEGMSGSIAKFSERMNQTARKLGMKRTHFRNPHGLPNTSQLTTARDMALLSKGLIHHFPDYYKLFRTRCFMYAGLSHANHNSLLGRGGIDGIKTGFFRKAGSNLAASAVRIVNGKPRRLIAVVLGGENRFARNRRITELLDRGFNQAHGTTPSAQTKPEPRALSYVEKTTPADAMPVNDEETPDPISTIIYHQEKKTGAAPLIYKSVNLPKPIVDKIHNRVPSLPMTPSLPQAIIPQPSLIKAKTPKMVWVKGTIDNLPATPTTKIVKKAAKTIQKVAGRKKKEKV